MTLVMAAAAFLTGIAADQRRAAYTKADDGKRDKTSPSRAAA
jgi:hypothetical protein